MKHDSRTTSNLVRHGCYRFVKDKLYKSDKPKIEIKPSIKKQALRLLSQWCIDNCRSYQLVQDSGFKQFAEFMASVGVKYGAAVDLDNLLPQPTIMSDRINKLYDTACSSIKQIIAEECNNDYGLTSDIWKDGYLQQSYISLTMHYINNGQLMSRLLGLYAMDAEESNASMSMAPETYCKVLIFCFFQTLS